MFNFFSFFFFIEYIHNLLRGKLCIYEVELFYEEFRIIVFAF